MLKKLIAALLATTMLLLFGAPALATTSQAAQYRVATANVNVRSGPNSNKYPVIGSLAKGELAQYLGTDGNWTKIAYKNATGYVFSQYLTDPLNQSVKYYRSATANVNVRTGPNSSTYPAIGVLKKGETVQYLGDSGSWAIVLYKGEPAYVFGKYLTEATTGGDTSSDQYRIATANVNIRTGPSSAKYPVIGFLAKGEVVKYLGTDGNWTKITYKDTVGYVFSAYLAEPADQSVKYYRSAITPVNVRSGPSSSQYPSVGMLRKGETVQYLGDSGNWAIVLYKGEVAYVFSKYLTEAITGGGTSSDQYRIATANVNVRTGPSSAKYPVMGYLTKGEAVQYLGASGNWSKVLFNGQIGYVFSQYLTK